jgi:1-acyl-sn-glycerol-3-phosphate acyltransferase
MFSNVAYFLIYATIYFFRLWWRWEIAGLENLPPKGQGALIAVNHLNWLDIPILAGSAPFSPRLTWFAKIEMFKHSIAAWFFQEMQAIPVKRGEADRHAFVAAKKALERGAVIAFFVEGTRSRGKGLLPGQVGAVRLAASTGCPIVPMAIWGTEDGFTGAMRRHPIHVRFGKSYSPAHDGRSARLDWDHLTEEMMLRIAALLPEKYWGVYHERMLGAAAHLAVE